MGELCELAGRRQSLVSYHLRQLRDGGLVSVPRSAADGRDSYYVLDLARCGEPLASAGVALHPALAPTTPPHQRRKRASTLARVLFLCTGNGARSQIVQPGVRVADRQLDADQAAPDEAAQELGPECLGLGLADVDRADLAPPRLVDAVRDHQRPG